MLTSMTGRYSGVALQMGSLSQSGAGKELSFRSRSGEQVTHDDVHVGGSVVRDKACGFLVHQREIPRLERFHTELCRVARLLIGCLSALLPYGARLQFQ